MIALVTLKDEIDRYIDRVLDGRQVACRTVISACRRHREDMARISDAEFPYEFNFERARACVQFFPLVLRHSVGEWAGLPFELGDWQQFIVWCLFGWVQKSDGNRRFRRAYISVGRKNGKSTVVAGCGLLLLHMDHEQGAQVLVSATKKEQANIIFGEAEKMTTASPTLASKTTKRIHNLAVRATNSFMRPTSSDRPYDGLNPHGVLLDELHAWTEQHRKFYETITSGSASRRQPLFVTCTTAGDDKAHIWREENDHACRVATGELQDDRLFSFVAAIDDDDDPLDEAVWEKANPNLGVSVKLDYLRQQAAEAKNKPTYRNAFVRYHCNYRVSSVEHCFTAEQWAELKAVLSDWSTANSIGIGIDLGGRDDLAAWAACARFKMGETGEGEDIKPVWRYELKAKTFIAKHCQRDTSIAPWSAWLYGGHLRESDQVIATIRDDVIGFSLAHGSAGVAFDPHNARQLGEELAKEGIVAVAMPQNCAQYNEPLREFINAAKDGRLSHDGNLLLGWCAANMAISKSRRDEWMPDKAESKEKIDTVVAAIMAFRVAYFSPAGVTGSLFVSG